MFAQPLNGVGPVDAEHLPFERPRTQAEPEAEIAVRGGLRRLCQCGDDQRVARVDRHDRGADPKPGHRRPDQPGQRDRVVRGLLGQPDLAHPEFVGAPGLFDRVVDEVEGVGTGHQEGSGGHAATNAPRSAAIPAGSR
ncbi:hypothetical protein MSAS_03970 [Mycobacterium saskatchewanense]|nr:hypothetical protein MSAS_03970 [Mycobacterium saskatchewanense]